MLLYATDHGLVLVSDGRALRLPDLTFDALLQDAINAFKARAQLATNALGGIVAFIVLIIIHAVGLV